MTDLTFRQAEHSDFPSLAKLISTTEAWTCYGIDYAQALGLFEKMEDTIFLALKNQEIVGFITLRLNGVGNIGAYIRMLAVAEHFRSQGIGKQLVEYAANLAFTQIPNLFLICSVENVRAQRFYEDAGFVRVGLLPDLVVSGHDEILYRKAGGTLR